MSLAVDFLAEFFARGEMNQTDFARAAGMTPTNVTDLLKGDVAISGRNLDKLLRGLRSEKDRRDFLTAFLRDQIPSDYADDIAIQLKTSTDRVADGDPDSDMEAQMILAFVSLPSDLYRRRVVRFVQQLRGDAQLRDLFARTVAYLEDEKGSGLSAETLKPSRPSRRTVEQEAEAASRRAGARALSQARKRKAPLQPKESAPESGGGAGQK